MRKLILLTALLTLSVGGWAIDRNQVVEEINNAADAAISEIQNASTADVAKPIQDKAIDDIDVAKNEATRNIAIATDDMEVMAEKVWAMGEINRIKAFALLKIDAIKQIQTAGQGIQNTNITNWINGAIIDIAKDGIDTEDEVNNIKNQMLEVIYIFQDGKTEGKAEGLGEMGTPCDDCPSIEVTKGDNTIRLYSPEKVEFKKE